MQRPCRRAPPRRLCRVKVKLTMWFAAGPRTARVAFRCAGFLQVPDAEYTGGVKQIGHCRRGEGWDTSTSCSAKDHRSKGGC